jgi:hypothetical protein
VILRRMTEHLKTQNWVAVGLDLAVVVLGVFLGFQVNEWKDARQSKAREFVAIERLHAEAVETVLYLQRFVSSFERLTIEQDSAVAALAKRNWSAESEESIETGIATLVMYPAVAPPRSTYDDLLNSGLFSDISYAALRSAVSEYYADLKFVDGQLEFFRQESDRSLDVAGDGIAMVYDPNAELRLGLEFDLQALSENRQYMSLLVRELRNQRMFQNYRRMLLESAESMCAALSEIVNAPCPDA